MLLRCSTLSAESDIITKQLPLFVCLALMLCTGTRIFCTAFITSIKSPSRSIAEICRVDINFSDWVPSQCAGIGNINRHVIAVPLMN